MAEVQEVKITAQQLESYFKAVKDSLSQETKDTMGALLIEMDTLKRQNTVVATKEDVEANTKKINEIGSNVTQMLNDARKNQEAIDRIIAKEDARKVETVDFKSGWNDILQKNIFSKKEEEIVSAVNKKDFSMSMELKVADMTSGAHVTGDVVHSYGSRQGIVPSQKWNLREILNTTISPTGSYVTYRETGTSGSISVQTEGQEKTAIDYSFTEVKNVSKYIAGVVTFTKQLMYFLPFLNGLLPRMLLRDFFKKENDYLYDTMIAAATGSAATPTVALGGPANDIEEIIFWIANQRTANFDASYGIVDWSEWAHMMKTGRNANSTYALPLSANGTSTGELNIAGTPIRGASWADAGEFLLWDNDFVERVETESLRVEFSYENGTNFTKNLITAKVECFEELSILRPDAIIHGEFGGS